MAQLIERDLDFAETAPVIAEAAVTVAGTPPEVWELLLDYPAWPEWFTGVKTCVSTSDPATGVGSTRTVTLSGGAAVKERFIAWEDEELWAFTGVEAPPLIRGLVERVTLAPAAGGRTDVTYRMALEPARGLVLVIGALRPIIERNLAGSLRAMDVQLALRR